MIAFDHARYAGFLLETLPALAAAPLRDRRDGPLDAALEAAPRDGVGVELGVWKGRSLRRAARRQPWRHFHGFDSLRGFPADGRLDWRQDFALPAAPRLPRNCTFHEGFFEATVPAFAGTLGTSVGFVNLDCDIHSSAWTALAALAPHLRAGTALHLDEAVNYDTWPWNEMLALFRLLEVTGFGIRWIARAGHVRDLGATLRFLEAGRYPRWGDDVAAGFRRQAAGVLVARAAPFAPAPEEIAARLAARTAAHLAGTQARQDCDPWELDAPPPPRIAAWRRWLRLR